MNKKRFKNKNKMPSNFYALGGFPNWLNKSGNFLSGTSGNTGALGLTLGGMGLASDIANVGSGVLNSVLNPNGNTTGVGNALSTIGSLASNIPGVGGLIGAGVNVVGGLVNTMFGSKMNDEFIGLTENNINNQSNLVSTASTNSEMLADWGSYSNLDNVSKSLVGSDGWFSNKAKKKARSLNREIQEANTRAIMSLNNTTEGIDTLNDFLINSRYYNFGGNLNTQGGDFPTGLTFIDEGGTHEENPNQGVMMGIDLEGTPNLVEEGEVIYNDYVFSNRLELPDFIKKNIKVRGKTFADGAKSLHKEIKERPNDPISKKGLEVSMNRLILALEFIKLENEDLDPNMFYDGGYKNIFNPVKLPNYTNQNRLALGLLERNPSLLMNTKGDISPIINNKMATNNKKTNRSNLLRYAPIIGSGLASITDIFSKPDYSGAEAIENVDLSPNTISFNPIGNKLAYKPLDRDFYINKMNAQTGATKRNIMNTSGGNRAVALAGLLASDYNYNIGLGDLARLAEEYNLAQKERVESFNRSTDMYNSDSGLKANMFNALAKDSSKRARLNLVQTAALIRLAIKDQNHARRSANITGFLQGLGDLGWENELRGWLDNLADAGIFKINTKGEYTGLKAKGGKLNKKKGLIYG